MERSKVIPATQEHVDFLKGKLRKADIDEVYAASGHSADYALQEGLKTSEFCWVGLYDEVPVACFGVRRLSVLSDRGIVWLLGTDQIKDVKREFVKRSIEYVAVMQNHFKYLENWVDTRNTLSKKWLQWCGFWVEQDPKPFGVHQLPFHYFWLRSKNHV